MGITAKATQANFELVPATGGYLKKKTIQEAWRDMWGNLSESKRKLFTDLPNFDKVKFKEITGIEL